jgi:uncharacterized membrane protein
VTLKQLIPPAVLLVFGILATVVGALFKIQHWPYGNVLLTIGSVLELLALLWGIVILIKIARKK